MHMPFLISEVLAMINLFWSNIAQIGGARI
jgi:hypothetical protein